MTTPNEVAGLIEHIAAKLEAWDMKPPPNDWTGPDYQEIAADIASILPPLSPTEATEPLVERAHPSLELCIQFDETGRHIRKWSRVPFVGGECLYSHPAPDGSRFRVAALPSSISNAEPEDHTDVLARRMGAKFVDENTRMERAAGNIPSPEDSGEVVQADALAEYLAEQDKEHWCNRLKYGSCVTRGCLVEAGWKNGPVRGLQGTCARYRVEQTRAHRLAARQSPDSLVGALERFLADYDDGDRADAGCSALMEAHVRDFRASLSKSPSDGEST